MFFPCSSCNTCKVFNYSNTTATLCVISNLLHRKSPILPHPKLPFHLHSGHARLLQLPLCCLLPSILWSPHLSFALNILIENPPCYNLICRLECVWSTSTYASQILLIFFPHLSTPQILIHVSVRPEYPTYYSQNLLDVFILFYLILQLFLFTKVSSKNTAVYICHSII